MEVTKAVKVALNTLVDIASHSSNGQLVPVPEIAQRLQMSISRIELLLRPLRESGLVIGIKGRTGGYQLLKDPRIITIKDIVLAMNRIKKRKVEVSDIAKELYQSLETYMMNCISNVTLASAIKDYIPRFSEAQTAPERKPYFPIEPEVKAKQERRPKGEFQKVVKTSFKKAEEIPRGPNSIFSFADYLNKNSPAN
ncbi:BadM/Rrf2 family transcriptional regulator [Polynucleobacter sp. QLW-P1DATA-2]|jgi:Rrf2 family iron-sulfur cluster assembly transcriptional regulator|uniref:RrF2 family transcriptional regulator n=1 Tax=unclassified Polynucleobacter TaxID=2640945 RepID=UPI0008F88241|nr:MULTISPECIES: Rrf2 family transcriptional regulator [unclassified Polynucleobacter]OIM97227.1 BadM/Rrf2 family transcriptional regulator [Polynucleobacter sp. QLW-P1DATA-2]OIN00030.1 BadM/Rrf2 family transcriptional regulator [Polynucleobacter sp. MWH-Tro8-2-5-gr]